MKITVVALIAILFSSPVLAEKAKDLLQEQNIQFLTPSKEGSRGKCYETVDRFIKYWNENHAMTAGLWDYPNETNDPFWTLLGPLVSVPRLEFSFDEETKLEKYRFEVMTSSGMYFSVKTSSLFPENFKIEPKNERAFLAYLDIKEPPHRDGVRRRQFSDPERKLLNNLVAQVYPEMLQYLRKKYQISFSEMNQVLGWTCTHLRYRDRDNSTATLNFHLNDLSESGFEVKVSFKVLADGSVELIKGTPLKPIRLVWESPPCPDQLLAVPR